MKKILFIAFLAMLAIDAVQAQQYEYKIVTCLESIVPNGLGRSRIIDGLEDKNYKDFASIQTEDGNNSNKSDRGDIRVKNFEETKILNFYNLVGIRMQNIAANDAVMSSKINTLVSEGWDLAFVTSAVESDSGKGDGNGIFISRYIFRKVKQ